MKRWFGFSPGVVMGAVVALVVVGAALVYLTRDRFGDRVAEACAAGDRYRLSQRTAAKPDTFFVPVVRLAQIHLAELGKLNTSGNDAMLLARLVGGEQSIVAAGARETAAQAQVALESGDRTSIVGRLAPLDLEGIRDLARRQDALYQSEFGLKHCSA